MGNTSLSDRSVFCCTAIEVSHAEKNGTYGARAFVFLAAALTVSFNSERAQVESIKAWKCGPGECIRAA